MGTHRLLDVEEKEWSRLGSSLWAFVNGYREGGHSFSYFCLFFKLTFHLVLKRIEINNLVS